MKKIPVLVAVLLPLLTACIDESYQMNDVSTDDLRILKDLTVPVGSTKVITLDQIIGEDPSKLTPRSDGKYHIQVTARIDDVNLNLDDLQFDEAEVRLTATNTIPLDFSLSVTCFDAGGNPIPNSPLRVESDSHPDLPAGTVGTPSTAHFVVNLTHWSETPVSGIEMQLDALTDDAHLGEKLSSEQGVRISDICLHIPSGIRVSL